MLLRAPPRDATWYSLNGLSRARMLRTPSDLLVCSCARLDNLPNQPGDASDCDFTCPESAKIVDLSTLWAHSGQVASSMKFMEFHLITAEGGDY